MKMVSKSCSGRPTTRDYYNSVEIDLSESRLLKHMIQIGYIVGIYCQSDVVVGMEWRFGDIKGATGPIRRSTDDFFHHSDVRRWLLSKYSITMNKLTGDE